MNAKVYFVGSSGSGKSTLARYVSTRYSLPMLTGATATAAETMGGKPDEHSDDIDFLDRYQKEVWVAQQALEKPHWEDSTGFVSDRAFDVLAYTARISRVAWQMHRDPTFLTYMQLLRGWPAVVFFCRPCGDISPILDGRRDFFLSPQWRYGIDGVIEFLLEVNEIPFISLEFGNLKDRMRTVDAVMAIAKKV